MDQLDYRELVRSILEGHGGNRLDSNTEVQLIFDPEHDRYQLLHIGWEGLSRVFGCIIYVEIITA